MTHQLTIRPQEGPQELFFSTPADIAIYGGAAGGGKTWALLVEPLRHITVEGFGGVIFRKTYPEITAEGALWDESMKIYMLFGSRPRAGMLDHTFPSGATITFAHMQFEQDKFKWQGSQIAYLGFDELTHFSESQFFYMLSRNRSLCGVRPYIRATCNPDPESWVAKFIAWWIDEDTGFPIPERSGKIRWFVRDGHDLVWADGPKEFPKRLRTKGYAPKSVTFIPANIEDNKILLEQNPEYLANLMSLPYVERAQLLQGNWKVRAGAGKIFHRDWFEVVYQVPTVPDDMTITPVLDGATSINIPPTIASIANRHDRDQAKTNARSMPTNGHSPKTTPIVVAECRFWDFAATKPSTKSPDPDFTAAVKIRRVGNYYFVVDVQAGKWGPAEVDRIFAKICREDFEESQLTGIPYMVRWEIEPGSAGIRETSRLVAALAGIDAKGVRPGTGEKSTRWKPLAVQAEAGYIKVKKAPWTESFLIHLHHQPESLHDDVCDATSGAFLELSRIAVSTQVATSYRGTRRR